MNITGSYINYYFVCERKLWLFHNNISSEHTSETVKIGKVYHELKYEEENQNVEVELDGIKIDKISGEFIEEFKKAKTEPKAAEMQILFYLWTLKQKGVDKKGVLKFKENKGNILIELSEEKESELKNIIEEIEKTLSGVEIPVKLYNSSGNPSKKCKGCSYFEFCWI